MLQALTYSSCQMGPGAAAAIGDLLLFLADAHCHADVQRCSDPKNKSNQERHPSGCIELHYKLIWGIFSAFSPPDSTANCLCFPQPCSAEASKGKPAWAQASGGTAAGRALFPHPFSYSTALLFMPVLSNSCWEIKHALIFNGANTVTVN